MREIYCNFSSLLNKTLIDVSASNDEINFKTIDGEEYCMCHKQDCCEEVYIEDICGDLKDLIGSPLLIAEEVNNIPEPDCDKEKYPYNDSYTWSFYKLSTIKGSVTIRWFGCSNGYYSERADLYKVERN